MVKREKAKRKQENKQWQNYEIINSISGTWQQVWNNQGRFYFGPVCFVSTLRSLSKDGMRTLWNSRFLL